MEPGSGRKHDKGMTLGCEVLGEAGSIGGVHALPSACVREMFGGFISTGEFGSRKIYWPVLSVCSR